MKKITIEHHGQILDVLKQEASARGNKGGRLGLRHVRASRLPLVEGSGTDRDAGSKVHQDEGDWNGSHPEARRVTYMRVVDVSGEKAHSVPLFRKPSSLLDSMDYLEKLPEDEAHLVYDPAKVYRASDNEFWFKGSPIEALIAIVIVKKKS